MKEYVDLMSGEIRLLTPTVAELFNKTKCCDWVLYTPELQVWFQTQGDKQCIMSDYGLTEEEFASK